MALGNERPNGSASGSWTIKEMPNGSTSGSWTIGRDQEGAGIGGVTGETTYLDPGLVGQCVLGPPGRASIECIRRGDGFFLVGLCSRGDKLPN